MSITQAFPKHLQHKVKQLLFTFSTSEKTFTVMYNGEMLQIPERIYNEELAEIVFEALDFEKRLIVSCLYTRHHNGFVRQKYTEFLLAHVFDEAWMLPYIVKLAGEYVIEIVLLIDSHKLRIPTLALRKFYIENEAFMELTRQRMISYWDVYYREQMPRAKQYIGVKLFKYFKQMALNPSYNILALEQFERNETEAALKLFEKALQQRRTVQALHNLAWMYNYEKELPDLAKPLLLEALGQQPKHHFPYSLLGEIYVKENAFEVAIPYLQQSLTITTSNYTIHNLAVALFELGRYEEAASYFAQVAGKADLVRLHEVVCYMKIGQTDKAKRLLHSFNSGTADFVGLSELAEVYIELGEYKRAYEYFKQDWQDGAIFPNYLFMRYAFVMYRLQAYEELEAFIGKGEEILRNLIQDLEKEQHTDPLDIEHAKEVLKEYEQQLIELNQLLAQLQNGFVPPLQYEVFATGSCMLYGCARHGHPELKKEN